MSREQSTCTILVAGMGTSPTVLTEAVWVLKLVQDHMICKVIGDTYGA